MCIFYTHFIGLAYIFLAPPLAIVDITLQGQMVFLTPEMLGYKQFCKDSSGSLTAEDSQEVFADSGNELEETNF